MIRVLLADDQKLVREGWCVLLDRSSDITIVGQARDGQEAVELAQELHPDVILMDVNMPRLDGLHATQQILERSASTKILMVTQSLEETVIRTALQEGAWGYLCKNDMFAELLPAVLALHAGQSYFSKTIRERYPLLVSTNSLSARGGCPHQWIDSSWAYLCSELERWAAQAHTFRDEARLVRQQSQTLRAQSRKSRAFTHELLRLRHPDAPIVT